MRELKKNGAGEVLVLDGNSTDGTAALARKAGALGAKLTGGGGEGGAVMVLADKKRAGRIIAACKKAGFKAFVVL